MAIDAASLTSAASLNSQADQLLNRARSSAANPSAASRENAKIEKAGKDFESILLGNWLQQAEQSFAKVPGGDGEDGDDDDSSKDQFQGIAMQALAGSLTASGGIGIAKMITQHLHDAAAEPRDPAGQGGQTAPQTAPAQIQRSTSQ
jgi:Rod binding domain-containing protein